ncbi:MAG: LUD domain-containing protein [Campylobacterales bacterium]|nr:LUD domain-containing protein [Campylobacterales bacterium]
MVGQIQERCQNLQKNLLKNSINRWKNSMNSKEKFFKKFQQFQSNKVLNLNIVSNNFSDLTQNFIQNAQLAGAKIYNSLEQVGQLQDSFLYQSTLAVAENGAIWCSNLGQNRHKLFSCNDLVLQISRNDIVPTMHEAYQKIDLALKEFGVFISGPSKTADIEQSLVIGAHGAMGLHIVIL